MTALRVGLLAPPWLPVPPPAYGGTESVIDVLARGLVAAGHDVVLWAAAGSGCPVPRAGPDRPPAGFGRPDAAVLEHLWVSDGLAALAGAGVDVIHDHTALAGAVRAAAGPGVGRVPVVVTVHTAFTPALRARLASGGHDALVAISAAHARTAGVRVDSVIHHGLDLARYPVGDGAGGYLAFCGRMAPEKGVHRAIRLARAAGRPLRIAAKMASADEHRYFEERVAGLLGGDVEYLGELAFADKVALLGGAEALVNPIRWPEPFGLVMAESLACGTPVLALGFGAAPEIVDPGRTGFLAATTDRLTDLVGRVAALDRRECRREVATRFTAERMVGEHVALYRDVLNRRPVPVAAAGS